MKNLDPQIVERAKRFCSTAEHCKSDVIQKLKEWKTDSMYFDEIIEILENEKFIDEKRFAAFFAKDKIFLNKWGKKKISYLLHQKNIPDQIIENALIEIDDAEYFQILEKELKVKHSQINKNSEPFVIRKKLIAFALQRGYYYHEVEQIISSLKL